MLQWYPSLHFHIVYLLILHLTWSNPDQTRIIFKVDLIRLTGTKHDPVDPDDPTRFQHWLQCLYHGFTKVYLYAPFFSPLLRRWQFVVCVLYKASVQNLVSAELAGALLMLFFACNATKSVQSSWKRSVVIHHDQMTHSLLWLITEACTLMTKHSVFSVRLQRYFSCCYPFIAL